MVQRHDWGISARFKATSRPFQTYRLPGVSSNGKVDRSDPETFVFLDCVVTQAIGVGMPIFAFEEVVFCVLHKKTD